MHAVPAKPSDDIEMPNVTVEPTLVYTALDPNNTQDFEFMTDWNRRLPEFAGLLNVTPLRRWSGGLEAIPEALDYLQAGKLSAEKIVVSLL